MTITDPNWEPKQPTVLKIGKKKFVLLIPPGWIKVPEWVPDKYIWLYRIYKQYASWR